jgi:class 3 adenylate cyclase
MGVSIEGPGVNDIMEEQNKVVMFADLLGFAALTEQHELDAVSLRSSDRLDTMFGSIFNKNPLTNAFTEFHRAMRYGLQLSELRHSSTAITFSDSAFVATARLHQAAEIAIHLIQSLLRNEVPVRIGIAHGSFEAVRFRSDIRADGGDHAAHFLGTGVVRAHATESCGIKGCRILLHPSAISLLEDPAHNPPLPAEEHVPHLECAISECDNRAGVLSEVNYWSFRPTEEKSAWRALQDMWAAAPEAQHHHYQATAEAINRMRIARGEDSIADLRRRTLPRRRS